MVHISIMLIKSSNLIKNKKNLLSTSIYRRLCCLMDKVLDSGFEDCKFESKLLFLFFNPFIFKCNIELLKCGFHNKSFIVNAPWVSCPIAVIRFGWVCCFTHPAWITENWAIDQRRIQNKWLVMKSILSIYTSINYT